MSRAQNETEEAEREVCFPRHDGSRSGIEDEVHNHEKKGLRTIKTLMRDEIHNETQIAACEKAMRRGYEQECAAPSGPIRRRQRFDVPQFSTESDNAPTKPEAS